ncbi:MAG: hypothetical protein ABIG93_05925 [archaeon]
MKEKSIFLEKEGYSPKNKVLDFLIVHQEFDYSIKEIAKYAEVSYPCMKQLKKELIKDKWVVLTRKVGRSQMYKLNIRNSKVKKFIDFFWEVIEQEIEGKHKELRKEHVGSSSPVGAVSVSAKSI